jgi:hypothetical protein
MTDTASYKLREGEDMQKLVRQVKPKKKRKLTPMTKTIIGLAIMLLILLAVIIYMVANGMVFDTLPD